MIDHIKVLKRAWQIVSSYRVLWVLGFILALVAAEGGGSSGLQSSFQSSSGGGFPPGGGQAVAPEIPSEVWGMVALIVVVLLCLGLILAIVFAVVVRYVIETALIRVVADYEKSGEKRGLRQAIRLGWSRTALRLFLIDLLVSLPVALVFFPVYLLAAVPLLVWVVDDAVGTATAMCLVFLFVLLAVIVGMILAVLKTFFWRACALEELGVVDSIRRGYAVVRQHLQDVAIMVLITAGLALVWLLVMVPVALLLVILGGVIAGVPALVVGGLASLAMGTGEAVPWILAAAVGLPIFILVMVIPLTFLDGLMRVFQSTTWTLTYQELYALAEPAPSRPWNAASTR